MKLMGLKRAFFVINYTVMWKWKYLKMAPELRLGLIFFWLKCLMVLGFSKLGEENG